jgi:oligopeptide/dipeptide ABC transporter ATP-binding protein
MEDNKASTILKKTHHPYTLGLINSLPTFGNHYSTHKLVSIPGNIPDPVLPGKGCPFAPRCRMVKSECSMELPALNREDGAYRCIIKGPKVNTENG